MKYIFTEEQFITLLALTRKMRLFLFRPSREMDDREIVRTIAELYQMGRLIRQKEQLLPSESLMTFIKVMEKARYIVKADFIEKTPVQYLLYPDDKGSVVILEGRMDGNRIIVKLWSERVNAFLYDLSENDMFPEELVSSREEMEFLEETAIKSFPLEYEKKDMILQIQRIQADTGESNHAIDVFQTDIFQWIHVYGEHNDYYHIYSSEELIHLLLSEMKGEMYD